MCVILTLETSKDLEKITLEILKSCELTNPDGNGYATLKDGIVKFEKGVSMEYIFNQIELGEIVAPCIIHARITSQGITTPSLCHPFLISENTENKMSGTLENNESVLFHNGTVSNWRDMVLQTAMGSGRQLPKGEMSDSRGLAFVLHTLGIQALSYLDVGTDKFAILNQSGLTRFGSWHDVNGVQSSNNYYSNEYDYDAFEYGSFPKNNYWADEYHSNKSFTGDTNKKIDEFNDEDNRFFNEPDFTPPYNYVKAKKNAELELECTPRGKQFRDDAKIADMKKHVKHLKNKLSKLKSGKSGKTKISKSDHEKNMKYLKLHGWSNPTKLTRKEGLKQVELMVRQNKIVSEIQDNKVKSAAWVEQKHKDFELTYMKNEMSIREYEDIYNEHQTVTKDSEYWDA